MPIAEIPKPVHPAVCEWLLTMLFANVPTADLVSAAMSAFAKQAGSIPHNQTIPAIGTEWQGQGGIYAGTVRGDAGQPDYHLIVCPQDKVEINWNDAMSWAKEIDFGGHRDYALPLRKEQAILFGNVPELFEKAWYWSTEQHASNSTSAWYQYFAYGNQYYDRKSYEGRARAVRRLVLQ